MYVFVLNGIFFRGLQKKFTFNYRCSFKYNFK